MFSSVNELPAHLFSCGQGTESPSAPKTAFGKAMRSNASIFDVFAQEVRAGDLKHGRNGVGIPYEWSSNGEAPPAADMGENEGAKSFRSGHPGAYGTYLRDAVGGKADDELVERPELKVHKLGMVGAGNFGMISEYDGKPRHALPWGG